MPLSVNGETQHMLIVDLELQLYGLKRADAFIEYKQAIIFIIIIIKSCISLKEGDVQLYSPR